MSRPKWNLNERLAADASMHQRCEAIYWELLQSGADEQMQFVADTRAVHKRLFSPYTPVDYPAYAGTYRGEQTTVVENANVHIFVRSAYCIMPPVQMLPPEQVESRMRDLGRKIVDAYTVQSHRAQYFGTVCAVFREFLNIHPYLNGNGHVARMMLALLMEMGGFQRSMTWTLHKRPYDGALITCFELYDAQPGLLESYLGRWFQ